MYACVYEKDDAADAVTQVDGNGDVSHEPQAVPNGHASLLAGNRKL